MLNADLHTHSTVSDGLLSPTDLVRRAALNGVQLLALTDHDEIGGLEEAADEAMVCGVPFINGVEISVSWGDDLTVHIVGLGFDRNNAALNEGLAQVRGGRDGRAQRIGEELAKVGIHGAYEGALKYAGNPALVSRSHFARYIVEQGLVKEVKTVFDYWLAKGKPGYVAHPWATMEQALTWIHDAGGVAVVAHPGRYRASRAELRKIFDKFKELGGEGIEVLSGSQSPADTHEFAKVTREYGFLASRASDFHGPGESWVDLGKMPELPEGLTPVWSRLI
ncbi:MAG: PHP domain-containing protein [Rhodocyclaceae bacterium]|nr:MAG: PHP domain-containing protein [Rhodocyclaceae bacterium]